MRKSCLLLVGATLSVFLTPVTSIEAATLSTSQLNSMLKDPSLKVSASTRMVMGTGPTVTVLAEEEAKNSDQDLKIDALLFSKVLMQAAPGQIETVKVLFSQSGRDGRFIVIGNKEIEDFSKGKIAPDKLLASLRFTDVEPERAPDVQPGTQFERRLLIWNRIQKLRQKGTGVGPFENIFREIESNLKAGDTTKVDDRLVFIENKLSDQEDQLKQARKSAMGHGVPAIARSSATPAPTEPARTNVAEQKSSYIPPEADRIKRIYMMESDNWIKDVDARNKGRGDKLRELKKQIDESFLSKQDSTAYELIGTMMGIVRQDLGFEPNRSDGSGMGGPGGPRDGGRGPGGDRGPGPGPN
jgi:hypothetical protein